MDQTFFELYWSWRKSKVDFGWTKFFRANGKTKTTAKCSWVKPFVSNEILSAFCSQFWLKFNLNISSLLLVGCSYRRFPRSSLLWVRLQRLSCQQNNVENKWFENAFSNIQTWMRTIHMRTIHSDHNRFNFRIIWLVSAKMIAHKCYIEIHLYIYVIVHKQKL